MGNCFEKPLLISKITNTQEIFLEYFLGILERPILNILYVEIIENMVHHYQLHSDVCNQFYKYIIVYYQLTTLIEAVNVDHLV